MVGTLGRKFIKTERVDSDMADAKTYNCKRCGTAFPSDQSHTEIVRRDFVEVPQPATVERLCRGCWEAYLTEFLGEPFQPAVDNAGVSP